MHPGQVAALDGAAGLLERTGDVLGGPVDEPVEVHRLHRVALATHAREGEQVVDQHLHPLGAVAGELDVLVGALVELAGVAALQQLAEARHLAQRLLQVVRGDVGELLEVGVRARELAAAAVELLAGPFGVGQLADDEHAHRLDVLAELGDLAGAGGEHLVVEVAVRHLPDLAGEPVRRRDHDAAQPLQQRQDAERDHHQGHGAADGERVRRAVEPVAGVVAQVEQPLALGVERGPDLVEGRLPDLDRRAGDALPGGGDRGLGVRRAPLRGGLLDGLELRERLGPAPDERAEPGDQLGLVGTPAGVGVEELGARQEDVAAHPGLLVDGGGVELLGGEQGGVEAVHELGCAARPGP